MEKDKVRIGNLAQRLRGLGTCCVCEKAGAVSCVLFLDGLAPIEGNGWGCAVCDLPPNGAIAVTCEACASQIEAGVAQLKYFC